MIVREPGETPVKKEGKGCVEHSATLKSRFLEDGCNPLNPGRPCADSFQPGGEEKGPRQGEKRRGDQ